MEKEDSTVKFAKRQGALDEWMGMIGATLTLNTIPDEKIYLPVTAGQYSLCRNCTVQIGHNSPKFREGRSPSSSILIFATESIGLLAGFTPHTYVYYQRVEKNVGAAPRRMTVAWASLPSSDTESCRTEDVFGVARSFYSATRTWSLKSKTWQTRWNLGRVRVSEYVELLQKNQRKEKENRK